MQRSVIRCHGDVAIKLGFWTSSWLWKMEFEVGGFYLLILKGGGLKSK